MSFEFQDYSGKGRRNNVGSRHKFPLLRLLAVAVAAFLVFWSGLPTKIVNALPLPGNDDDMVDESWQRRCEKLRGSALVVSDSLVQCAWDVNDSTILPTPFLRYLSSIQGGRESKVYWVANIRDFSQPLAVIHEVEKRSYYYHMMTGDSSFVWVRGLDESTGDSAIVSERGCRYPGVCPHMPMEWSALPITEGFDFEGQESLIAADVFRGLGEAPVYAILPGRVLNVGKDSIGYFVEIDHGNNITSRTSGLGLRNEALVSGVDVQMDSPIGRLPPKDSSVFYLSVRENGRFIRWKDFYGDAYPVNASDLKHFEEKLSALFGGL